MKKPKLEVRQAVLHLKKSDKSLARVISKVGPCTISKSPNSFLKIVEAIVSQQLSSKAASTIYRRFLDIYPSKPTPKSVATTSLTKLRSVGLSRMKSEYIKDLASHIRDKQLVLSRLTKLTDEEVIKQLTQIRGIGRWTAEMYLMFSLGRLDIFPKDDLGIQTAIKTLYHRKKLSPANMDKIASSWRPYRTIACWYLWKNVDNQ